MAATSSASMELRIRGAVTVDAAVDVDLPINPLPANCTFAFDMSKNTAFFKLRVSLPVPGNKNGSVYLHIPPEHISSISYSSHTATGSSLPRRRLQFLLHHPVLLIGPRGWVLPTSEKKPLCSSLRAMAMQTGLAVYLPTHAISQDEADILCGASVRASWTSCPKLAKLSTLYAGQGGQVISVPLMPEQSPPPYNDEAKRLDDDVSDRPPPKRQRPGRMPREDTGDDVGDVRKFCHELMAQHQLALRSEFLAGQTALRTEILGELKQMEERVLHATRHFVSEQIDGLRTEVADDIQEDVAVEVTTSVLDQVRDEYELYIDDRVDGIKLEMEAFVKDEMESAQDDVMNRFQEGTWQFRSA